MNFLMVKNNIDKHRMYDLSKYVWKVIFLLRKKEKEKKEEKRERERERECL